MRELLDIMRTLRAPDGCPWDREQTHDSLRRYLLEEAAEAVDALATGDPARIADELGDVLLQVAFHAVIAEEAGTFAYADVERAIVEKLRRRHPHVFGDVTVDDAEGVVRNWQAIKRAERGGREASPAERVPRSLPALRRAAGLDEALGWALDADLGTLPLAHVSERAEAIGAALLHLAQVARRAGVDPELALRDHLDARVRDEASGEASGDAPPPQEGA